MSVSEEEIRNVWRVVSGDCREILAGCPADSVDCVVTSPPYWGLRDYGVAGQLGLERTPEEYVANMVGVFREVRRVLRDDGTAWINLGDSYANDGKWGGSSGGKHVTALHGDSGVGRGKRLTGLKPKDLVGIPWRVAFALQADGWWLRSDIIWAKRAPMPESVKDRPTRAHEFVFLLAKSERYYFDADAVAEPSVYPDDNRKARASQEDYTNRSVNDRVAAINPLNARSYPFRNLRDVWTLGPEPFAEAHFAVMPTKLVEPCIKAGCPPGGTVLDPFAGAGTVGVVARRLGRRFLGIELNPEYAEMARRRIAHEWREEMPFATPTGPLFAESTP